MAGFRILYIPPRRVGPIDQWSGLNEAGGQSWILKRAEDLGFNAVWFSPMHETTAIQKNFYGKTRNNSLYAIRNHTVLDPEFSTGSDADDIKHYRHFTTTANKKGMTVFADLVFNHVAADHPAVAQEETRLQKIQAAGPWTVVHGGADGKEPIGIKYGQETTYHFLFKYDVRGGALKRRVAGPPEDPWTDVAAINYDSSAAQEFFLTGKNAYWKKQVDWYMDKVGVNAFRCDAAYMIPPALWQEIVRYAQAKNPKTVFLAETLGGPDTMVADMGHARDAKSAPAFDLGMIANHWWNFVDQWLPKIENPLLNKMSKFGGTGSPDNHDTLHTIAGYFSEIFNNHSRKDKLVAAISARNYAVSAFLGNSVYMQLGYELCNEKQNGVFGDAAAQQVWKDLVAERDAPDHALNISARIRQINDLKKNLEIENCKAEFKGVHTIEEGRVSLIHVVYRDVTSGAITKEVVLLVNRHPENGAVQVGSQIMQKLKDKGLVGNDNGVVDDVVILHPPVKIAPQLKVGYKPPKAA